MSATPGSPKSKTVFYDTIIVRTTHTCELDSWPSLERAAHVNRSTGATPNYVDATTGLARVVTLTPGLPAVATATITVPQSWLWGGGNLCASFPSALVHLVGVDRTFFILDVPTTMVSCGGPASDPFHVTVGPFTTPTPKHLVAVPFGDVQLSVPGSWWVQIPGSGGCVDPSPPGELVLGGAAPLSGCGAKGPANVAYLVHIKQVPPKYADKPPVEIHGVKVIVGPVSATSVTLYIPGYLEKVLTTGPLAPEIAGTLRFAPRLTALATGPVTKPAANWHLISWRGLGVWVPKSWKISYSDISNEPICSTAVTSLPAEQILFDSDQKSVYPPCPFQQPTAKALFGSGGNGLRMDLHPWKADSGRGQLSTSCLTVDHFTVCPYGVPQMGVLEVEVTGGGLAHPRLVWIGLSGSGQVAKTVLHSFTMVAEPLASS
ncbi:MAG: hypothetical protein ACLPQS_14440 [Acidimicrobiales bacterium]